MRALRFPLRRRGWGDSDRTCAKPKSVYISSRSPLASPHTHKTLKQISQTYT